MNVARGGDLGPGVFGQTPQLHSEADATRQGEVGHHALAGGSTLRSDLESLGQTLGVSGNAFANWLLDDGPEPFGDSSPDLEQVGPEDDG